MHSILRFAMTCLQGLAVKAVLLTFYIYNDSWGAEVMVSENPVHFNLRTIMNLNAPRMSSSNEFWYRNKSQNWATFFVLKVIIYVRTWEDTHDFIRTIHDLAITTLLTSILRSCEPIKIMNQNKYGSILLINYIALIGLGQVLFLFYDLYGWVNFLNYCLLLNYFKRVDCMMNLLFHC